MPMAKKIMKKWYFKNWQKKLTEKQRKERHKLAQKIRLDAHREEWNAYKRERYKRQKDLSSNK